MHLLRCPLAGDGRCRRGTIPDSWSPNPDSLLTGSSNYHMNANTPSSMVNQDPNMNQLLQSYPPASTRTSPKDVLLASGLPSQRELEMGVSLQGVPSPPLTTETTPGSYGTRPFNRPIETVEISPGIKETHASIIAISSTTLVPSNPVGYESTSTHTNQTGIRTPTQSQFDFNAFGPLPKIRPRTCAISETQDVQKRGVTSVGQLFGIEAEVEKPLVSGIKAVIPSTLAKAKVLHELQKQGTLPTDLSANSN